MVNTSDSYTRKFIMFEPYSKKTVKKPKGYLQIEIRNGKGKLKINVDGLKKINEQDILCKAFLVSKQLQKTNIGLIDIKNSGKGNIRWEFNPKFIRGTKDSIEKFNIITVELHNISSGDKEIILVANMDDDSKDITLLLNKLEDKVKTEKTKDINKIRVKKEDKKTQETEKVDDNKISEDINEEKSIEKKQTQEESKEKKKLTKLEKIDNEKSIEDISEVKNIEKQTLQSKKEDIDKVEEVDHSEDGEEISSFDNYEDMKLEESNDTQLEKDSVENIEDDDYDDFSNIEGNEEEHFTKENDTYKKYKEFKASYEQNKDNKKIGYSIKDKYTYKDRVKQYSKQISDYTLNILEFFDRTNPFRNRLRNYKWWEIEYDKRSIYRGFLPFYNYVVNIYYPHPILHNITTCQSLIKKYSHYIFGIVKKDDDIKYYVYGIPGKFTKDEQPYLGKTGFKTWVIKSGRNREKLGYWLLHVDALNGKVVHPLKPTPPK